MSSRSAGLRWLLAALALMALVAVLAAVAGWWWLQRPLALAAPSIELSIEPGTTPREVATAWVRAGVQSDPRLLYQWFRWSGQARQIRAGSYEIETGTTPRQLLAKMVQGDETMERVRLGEGWTLHQVRTAMLAAPHLKHLSEGMSPEQLMQALQLPGQSGEGAFFPDTYVYSRGVSDLTVLHRAHDAMLRHLAKAWQERDPDSPLKSMEQALILASVVEKETGPKDDPGMIAAVFLNRLRIGMPLQTDPTLIYGLGEAFDGNLRKRHLLEDHAYNTYTRAGLPPTPIALPSLAALRAVMRPTPSKALYFVSRGDGSSEFSMTLAEHNRAVNKYQRGGASRQP